MICSASSGANGIVLPGIRVQGEYRFNSVVRIPLKYVIGFALLWLPGTRSAAQILNVDRTDTAVYSPKAVWKGNVALGLEVDKQKTTLFDASNYFDAALQKNRELFILSSSDRFTYNGPQDFLNEGFVHLRWRHGYKNKIQPETYAQYQWDDKRGMVRRLVSGINLRYDIWHQHKWELALATGILYENELWNYDAVDSSKLPPNPVDEKSSKLKSNSYLKWEGKISAVSNMAVAVFYQAAFDAFFEPRIAGLMKFNVDISPHFAFGVNFYGLYDSRPLVPISNFYYSFSNSLLYKF